MNEADSDVDGRERTSCFISHTALVDYYGELNTFPTGLGRPMRAPLPTEEREIEINKSNARHGKTPHTRPRRAGVAPAIQNPLRSLLFHGGPAFFRPLTLPPA